MNLIRIKNIVVIYGPHDSCKTSALIDLYKLLASRVTSGMIKQKVFAKRQGKLYPDACYMCDYNGVIVAICTGGDDADVVLRNFMWMSENAFENRNVDLAFIAIREQSRRDDIGDSRKSLPLLLLEDLEDRHYLNVIRPFVCSGGSVVGKPQGQIVAQRKSAVKKLKIILKRWIAKNAL